MGKSLITWTAIAAAVFAPAARATINFNLIGLSAMPASAAAGFQEAANRWTNTLDATDSNGNSVNITVNLQVGFSPLGATTLGESAASTSTVTYSAFKSALAARITSPTDALAVASLPAGNSFPVLLNRTTNDPSGAGSATPYLDTNTDLSASHITNSIRASYADLRALGLKPASDSATDAQIIFSSDFPFDFNPADGIDPGKTDFVGVATHEIGHALGFSSGSTDIDTAAGHSGLIQDQDMYRVRPLDLFRYSSSSTALGAIDLSADTRNKYFSLDKGVTSIAPFATGQYFGDGFQASHWKEQTPSLGLMDPGIAPGEESVIGPLDREAMDVIGYKLINVGKWTDTSSSSTARWSNAVQWASAVVPDGTISAVFANHANYIVSVDTLSTAKDITVGNDNVTFSLSTSNLTCGTLNIGQTSGDVSTLTVQRTTTGQFTTGNINIAAAPGTTGTLNILPGAVVSAAGNITGNGSANLIGGTLSANQIKINSLSLTSSAIVSINPNGGNSGTSRVSSLSITSASQLDLTNNDLIVDYTTTSPASTIRALLASAYNAGTWTGPGLASSSAATDSTRLRALGYATAADVGITTFDAQSVTNAVLVKFTYYGDSSLDGKVDLGNDFNLFLQGFLAPSGSSGSASWELGDYNYDGVVNTADFQLFVNGYTAQGSPLGALDQVIAATPLLSVTQKSALLSVVPEPSTALMMSAAISLLATPRQRRK